MNFKKRLSSARSYKVVLDYITKKKKGNKQESNNSFTLITFPGLVLNLQRNKNKKSMTNFEKDM